MTVDEVKGIAARTGRRAFEAGARHEAIARARAAGKGGEPGFVLAEGLWLNRQAMEFGAEFEALFICPELIYSKEWAQVTIELIGRSAEIYIISEKVYDGISREKSDRGLLSVIRMPRRTLGDIPEKEMSIILVLDGLENPGNAGTLIRTAEGAGADAVILCGCRTGIQNPIMLRSSLCALLSLPVVEAGAQETIEFVKKRGFTIYLGKDDSHVRYCDTGYAFRSAIVAGHEKYGVGEAWLKQPHIAVSIPMLGKIDSLNVAVAGGILLYEAGRSHDFRRQP